jgi:hypothetical protein
MDTGACIGPVCLQFPLICPERNCGGSNGDHYFSVILQSEHRLAAGIGKNQEIKRNYCLIVLPPGVAAFSAAEETHLALISRSQLAEPPEREIIFALRAPDLDGGQGFHLLPFVIHDSYLVLPAINFLLHIVSAFDLADIPTLPALELTPRRHEQALTFRTKHRYTIS